MDIKQLPPPLMGKSPPDRAFTSEPEMRAKVQAYFDEQKASKRPYLMTGICLALCISRETLSQYMRGKYDDDGNKYSDTLKNAKMICENQKMEEGLLGNYQPHVLKFDLINNHGYAEKVEHVVTPGDSPGDNPPPDKDAPPLSVEDARKAYQAILAEALAEKPS
jgi:hypothetical protein